MITCTCLRLVLLTHVRSRAALAPLPQKVVPEYSSHELAHEECAMTPELTGIGVLEAHFVIAFVGAMQ